VKNNRHFLRCEICGNIVGHIEDGGAALTCCGQAMTPLVPNTTDAAGEKHLPFVTKSAGAVDVRVGSVAHPMTDEHCIGWIAVAQGPRTQRLTLRAGSAPEGRVLLTSDDPVTVYAWCNQHGLWAADAD